MSGEFCCTCASPLDIVQNESLTEKKSLVNTRRLNCCRRAICSGCIEKRPQFANYCPFCQLSDGPSALPQGLRDPPVYSVAPTASQAGLQTSDLEAVVNDASPPAYSPRDPTGTSGSQAYDAIGNETDVIHFLHPSDTITSLSLVYSVPPNSLRGYNSLYSDHLLAARKTISIPRSLYSGPSLSPHRIESQEEHDRKSSIRRFMIRTKCHDYDIAELYVKQANGDVDKAADTWNDDERWEKDNPFKSKNHSKSPVRSKKTFQNAEGGLVGQLR